MLLDSDEHFAKLTASPINLQQLNMESLCNGHGCGRVEVKTCDEHEASPKIIKQIQSKRVMIINQKWSRSSRLRHCTVPVANWK
jgi:hypothetical protein